jgi:hypothetical protein
MTHFARVLCVPYGSIITMVGKMSQFHLDVFRTTRLVSTPPLLRLAGGSDPGLSRGTLLATWVAEG